MEISSLQREYQRLSCRTMKPTSHRLSSKTADALAADQVSLKFLVRVSPVTIVNSLLHIIKLYTSGPINETLGVLNIASSSFLKEETVYEILLEIRYNKQPAGMIHF